MNPMKSVPCSRCGVKPTIERMNNPRYWKAQCPACGRSVSWNSSPYAAQENWNAKMDMDRLDRFWEKRGDK